MSNRGEIVPELAALIESIANRIETGEATAEDARRLRKLACQAAGLATDWELRVHKRGKGRPKAGAPGVRAKYELARKVANHRATHGLKLHKTYPEVTKIPGTPGEESIKKAWQEMGGLTELDRKNREMILRFMEMQATGMNVRVRRVRRKKR